MIKFVDFNDTLGPAIIHDAVKNAESDKYQSQQCSMGR
jgi:hypothetical protein